MSVCLSMDACVHGACGFEKKELDPLKLESQAVVNHLIWVLGIELRSSENTASTLYP